MEINGHLAKVRLWIKHTTWVHMHAKFQEDFLNTSAFTSRITFLQSWMLHKGYQPFGQNKFIMILVPKACTILKDARFVLVTSKDMIYLVKLPLM